MRGLGQAVLMAVVLLVGGGLAYAQSETEFPEDWRQWTSVSTPLTEVGAIPGCDADVSALPPIYRETVATYCNVRPGGPGAVDVLVRPEAMDAYEDRDGNFPDGPNAILHLKELGALFVTGHEGDRVLYGVYTENGEDATKASGALSAEACRTCHTGYRSFCVNGQCGRLR